MRGEAVRGPVPAGRATRTASATWFATIDALERAGWHVMSAAAELGLTKQGLYQRIQRYGLRRRSKDVD